MSYEEFKNTIAQVLVNQKEMNLKAENIKVHSKGEIAAADDEKGRLWIQEVNEIYFHTESDTLLGDFLEVTVEHTEDMSTAVRYDLTSLYDAYSNDGWDPVLQIMSEKLRMCRFGQTRMEHLAEYEKMRDWLVLRPVNYDERREELRTALYKRIGDIAIVLYILLYEDKHNYNTCICPREAIESWGVPEEELWKIAMRNTMLGALPRIYFKPEDTCDPPYNRGAFMAAAGHNENFKIGKNDVPVVTTTRQINGAIAMFYPEVQERLAELFGGEYYVAFTATDSAMIHPVGSVSPRELLLRLKHVRNVMPEEFLSKYVYKYNSVKKEIEQMYL